MIVCLKLEQLFITTAKNVYKFVSISNFEGESTLFRSLDCRKTRFYVYLGENINNCIFLSSLACFIYINKYNSLDSLCNICTAGIIEIQIAVLKLGSNKE